MKALWSVSLACLLLTAVTAAGSKPPSVPDLKAQHENASRTVRFRTPPAWTVANTPGDLEQTETRGDGLILRILRRDGELGLDSLHVECMAVRLAGPMETRPEVDYEYDFLSGNVGVRRVMDSAFVVHYDAPIEGSSDWRQRNLTVIGQGESLCVIAYAPAGTWKKSKQTRNLLKAVVDSVEWRPWR